MCSWCYGFTNSIQELRARYGDRTDIILVMGGLRPAGTHVVDDHYRNFLRRHWQEIGERTDQPFDLAILDETGWIYDTEKACRAVVTMRRLIGVNSFPTVLVEDENGLAALTVGYRPFSELAPPLERWLEQ